MSGIKIPVTASLDQGSIDQVVQKFQSQLNQLGTSIAQANKVKFKPVDQSTLDHLHKVNSSFDNLRKVSGDLNKRMKATGQEKAGFLDVDWSKMYPDVHSRSRQMQKAFEYVVGRQFQANDNAVGGDAAVARPPPPGPTHGGGPSPLGQAAVGVVQSGLRGAGAYGGVAANSIGQGMSGGMGAGMAGLMGGIAALALGRAVSAVAAKVGDAQSEAIGFDTLKRTLGDVNIGFNQLKTQLYGAARNVDMTFEESLRLGTQFARISGMSEQQYRTMGEEVTAASGFSRSFGLDPSESNAFFAQMRQYGVTETPQESRDLALMIGEGVAKAGTFSKMDEVLQAIAGFTAGQSRTGLNAANVAGYTELLTGLTSSGRPGLDPASAAALMGRVNSSIAGGGSAGEAGQNFMYSAMGSRLGLNPIQAKILQEQGAFGTGRRAFGTDPDGKDSMYAEFAKKHGISTPSGAAISDVTNLQMIKEHFEKVYADKPELMVDAMANLFGVNISQAMALSSIENTQLGGLSARLKKNNVNINDVNATGISRISQIEANSSLSEAEKDRQIKEAATQNQESTEGSRTRATINGVERAVVDMASKLIEPLNAMRSGIMLLAGEGKMSQRQIIEKMTTLDSKDRVATINSKYGKLSEAQEEKLQRAREKGSDINATSIRFTYRDRPDILEQKLRDKEVGDREKADALAELTRLEKERAEALKAESEELQKQLRIVRGEVAPPSVSTTGSVSESRSTVGVAGGAGAGNAPATAGRRFGTLANVQGGVGRPDVSTSGSVSEARSTAAVAGVGGAGNAPAGGDRRFGTLSNVRGYRNNNPGNIEATGRPWVGQTGSDGRFATFDSPENGYRALGKNLLAYQNKHGLNTVRQMINRWAPPGENNTGAYVAKVAKELGVGPDDPLDMNQQATLQKMITAIARHENGGLQHSQATIGIGARRALGMSDVDPSDVVPGGKGIGGEAARDATAQVQVNGTFVLQNSAGQQVAPPVTTRTGVPVASGARR